MRRSSALAVALACAASSGAVAACSGEVDDRRSGRVLDGPSTTAEDAATPRGDGGVPVLDGGGSGDASGDAALPNRCPSARGPAMLEVAASGGRGFCIDATEVTGAQYRAFVAATDKPARIASCAWNTAYEPLPTDSCAAVYAAHPGDEPVTCVDWCDAWTYCAWAGKRLCGRVGGGPRASTSDGARDPATNQWFAACTGGDANRTYAYGAPYDPKRCNGSDYEAGAPLPVTSLPACVGAAPGLYGMSGNAAELGDACDPAADGRPESDRCALHGGGFVHGEENVRCATYYLGPRSGRFADLGFRCCAD